MPNGNRVVQNLQANSQDEVVAGYQGEYAYYRRIIEDQKNRLLDEIIRVARHLGSPAEAIRKLDKTKNETQFSKAVESVKEVIPEALRIRTHNPHSASQCVERRSSQHF